MQTLLEVRNMLIAQAQHLSLDWTDAPCTVGDAAIQCEYIVQLPSTRKVARILTLTALQLDSEFPSLHASTRVAMLVPGSNAQNYFVSQVSVPCSNFADAALVDACISSAMSELSKNFEEFISAVVVSNV